MRVTEKLMTIELLDLFIEEAQRREIEECIRQLEAQNLEDSSRQ